MLFDTENFLKKYYTKDDAVILACSTGPDSMFLLHHILQSSFKKNLIVCYFDHNLRKDSKKEVQFIQLLADTLGFKLELGEEFIKELQKKEPSIGIEELARNKRYTFLEKIRKKYNSKYIITGHHLDDRLETFFFNLIRGSKLTGLINMQELSGNILRPLIYLEKKEILEYLKNKNLSFSTDLSNTDTNITRNYLRIEILEKFGKINLLYKRNIQNFIEYLEEMKVFIDVKAKKFIKDNDYFYIDEFLEKPPFFQREIIRYCFYIRNNNSTIGLSEKNIEEIIKCIKGKNNKTEKKIKHLHIKKDNTIIRF